jgi:hypothetical protein
MFLDAVGYGQVGILVVPSHDRKEKSAEDAPADLSVSGGFLALSGRVDRFGNAG